MCAIWSGPLANCAARERSNWSPVNKKVEITAQNLSEYLGAEKYRYGKAEETDQVGAATGLAWTEAGGDTLSIEVSILPGKRKAHPDWEVG